jgi:hypothetical protein
LFVCLAVLSLSDSFTTELERMWDKIAEEIAEDEVSDLRQITVLSSLLLLLYQQPDPSTAVLDSVESLCYSVANGRPDVLIAIFTNPVLKITKVVLQKVLAYDSAFICRVAFASFQDEMFLDHFYGEKVVAEFGILNTLCKDIVAQ